MRCGPCFNFPGQQSEPEPGLARIRAPHHHVSTSPDNKVIRNQPRPPHPGSAAKVLTSPDSKTIRNLAAKELRKVIIDPVSTSPDSKAIRNGEPVDGAGVGQVKVSTSPDSKAIRNGHAGARVMLVLVTFQLPRIAKPSGTRAPRSLETRVSWWFQLPRIAKPSGTQPLPHGAAAALHVVSTSPDSKAIRNGRRARRPADRRRRFNFTG